jgi:hypothetical protein
MTIMCGEVTCPLAGRRISRVTGRESHRPSVYHSLRNDRVMTARCCGCGRALEVGKELVEKRGKKGKKGEKGKKRGKQKKNNAGLLTWPAFNVILCLDAGTPPSWWPCADSSKLACCHATPLPPCSCTRFALLSSHHHEFHTYGPSLHSKRNGQFNLVQQTFCDGESCDGLTDSGTEGVDHRQRVKGVVGGAKKARAHIHAQACGWARWQRKLTSVARVGGVGGRPSCIRSHGPFLSLVSSVESVEFS